MISLRSRRRLALRKFPVHHGQFGEDALLATLFDASQERVIVDVGAHDGITGSNSYLLEQLGWRCVMVEPNPRLAELIRIRRNGLLFECALSAEEGSITLHAVDGEPGADGLSSVELAPFARARIDTRGYTVTALEVPCRTLDAVMAEAHVNGVDVLSLDVEGHEAEVLAGFDIRKWRPRVVLVEDNSDFSDPTIPGRMAEAGYRRVFRTGVNDWYAHRGDPWFDTAANRIHVAIVAKLGPLRRFSRPVLARCLDLLRPWLARHQRVKRMLKTGKRLLGIRGTF